MLSKIILSKATIRKMKERASETDALGSLNSWTNDAVLRLIRTIEVLEDERSKLYEELELSREEVRRLGRAAAIREDRLTKLMAKEE